MVTEIERRTCGICGHLMEAHEVKAALPLLPVFYKCPRCDAAPLRQGAR